MRATCHAHFILLNLLTLMILGGVQIMQLVIFKASSLGTPIIHCLGLKLEILKNTMLI